MNSPSGRGRRGASREKSSAPEALASKKKARKNLFKQQKVKSRVQRVETVCFCPLGKDESLGREALAGVT